MATLPPKPEIKDMEKRALGLKQRIDYRKSGENPSTFVYRSLHNAGMMMEEVMQFLERAKEDETDGIELVTEE